MYNKEAKENEVCWLWFKSSVKKSTQISFRYASFPVVLRSLYISLCANRTLRQNRIGESRNQRVFNSDKICSGIQALLGLHNKGGTASLGKDICCNAKVLGIVLAPTSPTLRLPFGLPCPNNDFLFEGEVAGVFPLEDLLGVCLEVIDVFITGSKVLDMGMFS